MRITKEKKQENHAKIVTVASEMFRERGFDGVGVADLMEKAGMTHGGFYNHFASKEALIAEAAAQGFVETAARYAGYSVRDVIDGYISRAHRDARGQGCSAAALSGEAARLPNDTRAVLARGSRGCLPRWSTVWPGSRMQGRRPSAFWRRRLGLWCWRGPARTGRALVDEILETLPGRLPRHAGPSGGLVKKGAAALRPPFCGLLAHRSVGDLDHDLALGAAGFHIGEGLGRLGKGKDLVHHRAE